MFQESGYTELTRIEDPIEADLLAAFLKDGDIAFIVVNRHGGAGGSSLIPRTVNAALFRVQCDDYERGRQLLEEYRQMKNAFPFSDRAID